MNHYGIGYRHPGYWGQSGFYSHGWGHIGYPGFWGYRHFRRTGYFYGRGRYHRW